MSEASGLCWWAGTHFRYGTISWRPNLQLQTEGAAPQHYWAAGLCDFEARSPPLKQCPVTFTFKAAYRRNYDWGRFFREQWRSGTAGEWQDAGSCYCTGGSCPGGDSCQQGSPDWKKYGAEAYQNFDITQDLGTQTADLINYLEAKPKHQEYVGYQIRLAVSRSRLPPPPHQTETISGV